MESENSEILTSCGVGSLLLKPLKDIMNSEKNNSQDEYFLVPEESGLQINEKGDNVAKLSEMCRTCASIDSHLIPIFKDDGLEHNLSSKIQKHLPIKVCETDNLPLQVCYHCAATLLAWDDLCEGVLSAQSRLLRLQEQAEQRKPAVYEENSKADDTQLNQKELNEGQETSFETDENPKIERSKRRVKKRFVSKRKLETKINCDQCGKSFTSSSGLRRHVRDVHEGLKKHECEICGRPFASRVCRDEHRLTHTGERPNVCEICGKTFTQKASLHVHKRFHSEILSHWCEICGRGFKRNQELKKHVLIHTGQKPFTCEQCGKCFRSRGCISRHKKTHSTQKLFTCDICGANFAQERYLKTHRILKHKLKQGK